MEKKGFGPWRKRFGESYGEKTRLSDLADRTVYLLALPGEDSTVAFYELIMGILGLGHAPKFTYLENNDQMTVVDVHFFLADQVRFEMMCRLGWLDDPSAAKHRIIEMVRSFEKVKAFYKDNPPQLSAAHPDVEAYRLLHDRDREAFIRRLLPDALESFKERIQI